MMNLVAIPNLVGGHLGGWRHRDAFEKPVMNLEAFIEMTEIAERGKLDAVFLADGNGVRDMDRPALFAANHPSARPAFFEPTTLLSAVAMVARRIGVVATATSTYDEPWMVARRFASMDHISKGRAGWNLVTASNAGDALNFGRAEHMGREDRYARAQEFYEVVAKLWDSWADDAFPQDKASGQYLDPARVRPIDHRGSHFTVKGPLNISPTPQGRPVVFMAGQSGPGMELAARYADALFGAGTTKQDCIDAYADIKGRMARYGRAPDTLKILPGVSTFVGRTAAEAEELYEELQSLISPPLGVHYLSKMLVHDLEGLPLDGPLPADMAPETLGGSSLRRYIIDMARRDNLTIRQTYERTLPALGGPVFKGSAAQVADEMEDWWRSKAADGFTIMAPVQPRGLSGFVDLVVPELQRRGIFRKEYETTTVATSACPMLPASGIRNRRQGRAAQHDGLGMMVLGFTGGALGGHLGGWRHRDSFPTTSMQLQCMIEMAQIAERGGIDMMFLADGNGVRQMDKPALFAANSPSDRPAVFEPVTLFSAVAQHTSRIGLVATATTSYEEPFTIARKFASLDHLSGGRAGWNLVTTQYVEDSKNFGRDEHFGREDRYERARESLDVVRALWDSWASDAFIQDKATGRYLDPDRVRLTNHRGKHFAVKGPLNVARTPQGQPVVFMAGQSEAGKELAAYGGEGLFGTASNKAEAQTEYADIKGRMKKYGRPADALRILPALSVFVGRTAAEADALFDELQALISPALAVSYLSKVAGVDLAGVPIDGPMPQRQGESLGGTAIGRSVLDMAARERLSVRATYERVLPTMGGNMVKGDPIQVADMMEDWYRSKACDGFMLSMPVEPRSLRDFVELVVPELQRRGLRPTGYRGTTLRDSMGLPHPTDPFLQGAAAG